MFKKFALSFSLILSFALYALFWRPDDGAAISLQPADGGKQIIVAPPAPSSEPAAAPAKIPITKKAFRDGEFVGAVADAFYGSVQVKALIRNGMIADVQFLDYPSERSTSVEINTRAMPILRSEAIRAQSAEVDVVSGATFTSQAFQESLGDALSLAKN